MRRLAPITHNVFACSVIGLSLIHVSMVTANKQNLIHWARAKRYSRFRHQTLRLLSLGLGAVKFLLSCTQGLGHRSERNLSPVPSCYLSFLDRLGLETNDPSTDEQRPEIQVLWLKSHGIANKHQY